MSKKHAKVNYKNINTESWIFEDKEHNDFGPCFVKYGKNGLKQYQEYRIDGKRHREDGPARCWETGYCEFWTHGVFVRTGQS